MTRWARLAITRSPNATFRSIEHARARSDGLAEVALKANRDEGASGTTTSLVLIDRTRNWSCINCA